MKRRINLRTIVLAQIVLITGCISANAETAQPAWQLMSRHGECIGIDSLKQTFPNLPDVSGPASLLEFLRSEGYFVQAREFSGSAGRAHEIKVSDLSLNLVIVRETLCPK